VRRQADSCRPVNLRTHGVPYAGAGLRTLVLAVGVVGALFPVPMRAAEVTNLPPVLPPPAFMANKSPLPDLLLKDKRAGSYYTGFPAIGWDPETGFNYGAALQWFDNGPADSPFFRYTPYRQRVAVAGTASTGGSTRAAIGYDQPYVADSPWRIRTAALFNQNKFENYFGVGESTLGPLTYPGSPRTFDNFDDYTHALEQNVGGQTWARYNQYERTEAGVVFAVERDYWGGWLRPQLGLQFNHVEVHDYTGEDINGAVMQPTRLFTDQQAGNVTGFNGGWDNALKVGLTFDTRDFEPDPASGGMLQTVGRISSQALGSAFDYEQITLSGRGFHNLLGETGRLVLAGRATYTMQFGQVPFYSAPTIPFTDGDVTGLGGHATMRGFVTDRFVGDAAALVNGEMRWSIGEKMLGQQHLRFMLVPFVDTGRVFNSAGDTTLEDWKIDGGIGFRLAWNLSTLVSFDYARSGEGSMFYMELGHQF
jgi:outer membrane protein assembly factor BamA